MSRTIWKPVRGFEAYYEVSNSGVIRSKWRTITDKKGRLTQRRGRIMQPRLNNRGYLQLQLKGDGVTKSVLVHRVVAEAFLQTDDYDMVVNHRDTNKLNCHVDNLEWSTQKDNTVHAYENGLRRRYRHAVISTHQSSGYRTKHRSIAAAARFFSLPTTTHIRKALDHGGIAHNRTWEYQE